MQPMAAAETVIAQAMPVIEQLPKLRLHHHIPASLCVFTFAIHKIHRKAGFAGRGRDSRGYW